MSTNMNLEPAAIVAPAQAATTILQQWAERAARGETTATGHAFYALARYLHSNPIPEDHLQEYYEAALRKVVKGFSPVTNPRKLQNGQRAFGALFSSLDALREGKGGTFGLTVESVEQITILADRCFKAARALKEQGLYALSPTHPTSRTKKPDVHG